MIQLQALLDMLSKRSVDDRYRAAEEISEAIARLGDAICHRLLEEKNELVLLSILEILEEVSFGSDTLQALFEYAASDKRPLVRAGAIAAIGRCLDVRRMDFLLSRLLEERNPRVKLELVFCLFKGGFRGVFRELVGLMKSGDYQTQCAAIHRVLEVDLDEQEMIWVLNELKDLATKEPRAVATTARDALIELQARHDSHSNA